MVKRYRSEESTSYTFGIDLTLELIRYQLNVVNKVYVHPLCDKQDPKFIELMNQCQRYRIPVEESAKSFNILAVKENPTVIGEFRKYFAQLNDKDHLVLVDPQDLYNLGVVIRAALGFGITNIAIIAPGCDSFNPKVLTASKGARFAVNIQYFENFAQYSKLYGHHDVYPFSHRAKTDLTGVSLDPGKYYSLIFGNETHGLPDEYLDMGTPILINHSRNVGRLDLPIALSIALYELTKNSFKK